MLTIVENTGKIWSKKVQVCLRFLGGGGGGVVVLWGREGVGVCVYFYDKGSHYLPLLINSAWQQQVVQTSGLH